MQIYRKRQQQLSLLERIEHNWKEMAHSLEKLLGSGYGGQDRINPVDIYEDVFPRDEEPGISIHRRNQEWLPIRNNLEGLVNEARKIIEDWEQEKQQADWLRLIQSDMSRYEQLKNQLEQQGIDPEHYPRLLQQRESAQQKLQEIDQCVRQKIKLGKDQDDLFDKVRANREKLTHRRKQFLTSVLQETDAVDIKVVNYGQDWSGIETDLRALLSCDDRFNNDIEALKSLVHCCRKQRNSKTQGSTFRIYEKVIFQPGIIVLPDTCKISIVRQWPI